MVRVLNAGSTQLKLTTDPTGWCRVEISFDGRRLPLGGDAERVVIGQLRSSLHDQLEAPSAGTIGDVRVVWILSLAERHTTFYAAQQGDKRLLFFQDRDGNLLTRIELLDTDRQRWISELNQIERAFRED